MKCFLQDGNALFWERNHEKMCIEPWGSDSLRVRASMGTDLQMDLPGGLIDHHEIHELRHAGIRCAPRA